MKVLITGGLGFIGSHIAEKFYKEGHRIFIIDNLSTGSLDNLHIKYKFFKIDVEDTRCGVIFKENNFDVVIHLAGQMNIKLSNVNPYNDAKSNILGLVNILELSRLYLVKKFIYASSGDVYGDSNSIPFKENDKVDPVLVNGINKKFGEEYCERYFRLYGLETLVFRISNVYGPKEALNSGNVSELLGQILSSKSIEVQSDIKETRDYIFIEDVAEGFNRGFNEKLSGIYNLSTNIETSLHDIISIIQKKIKIENIDYKENKINSIKNSKLDNNKLFEKTNWIPSTLLSDGILKTFEWYEKNHKNKNEELIRIKNKGDKKNKIVKGGGILPYIETILAFIVVAFLTMGNNNVQDSYSVLSIDYKLVYIIIIAIAYGTRQASIAIVLSCLFNIYLFLASGNDILAFVYNLNNPLQLALYIGIGVYIGYAIDKRNREIYYRNLTIEVEQDKNEFLNQIYNDTLIIKEELRNQIINSKDSFGRVFEITKELEVLQIEDIFNAAITVIESVMETKEIAIYKINKGETFLRLMSKSRNLQQDIPNSLSLNEYPYLNNILNSKEVFINKEFDQNKPVLVAPLGDIEYAFAMIFVYKLGFESMTLYTENKFNVVLSLISSALFSARRLESARYEEIYIRDTKIMLPVSFERILKSKIQAKEEFRVDFVCLEVELFIDKTSDNIDYYKFDNVLKNLIRECDYVGKVSDNKIYIILSNTSYNLASIVIERLRKKEIYTSILSEYN